MKPEDEKDMTNDAIANGHASSKSGGKGLAERAFHPEELQENPNLRVDLHYYLTQQLHPVISRFVASNRRHGCRAIGGLFRPGRF